MVDFIVFWPAVIGLSLIACVDNGNHTGVIDARLCTLGYNTCLAIARLDMQCRFE